MPRILPSRFYTADPADLADELIAARSADAEWQTRQLLDRVAEATRMQRDDSRRYLSVELKRLRIQALVKAAKGKV